ncbi:hypothetical protein BDR05DRAFT_945674 [Suillus weaverae]|nr:hypothetical protein BDR05DRAFT_945674 [Suillus weaverae]
MVFIMLVTIDTEDCLELTSTTSLNHLRFKNENFARLLQLFPGLKPLLWRPSQSLEIKYHHQEVIIKKTSVPAVVLSFMLLIGCQMIMISHSPILASILNYLYSHR